MKTNTFQEGRDAFLNGIHFKNNPYEKFSWEWTDWLAGWSLEKDESDNLHNPENITPDALVHHGKTVRILTKGEFKKIREKNLKGNISQIWFFSFGIMNHGARCKDVGRTYITPLSPEMLEKYANNNNVFPSDF